MELIALPYRPNASEYLALINSDRIRGDQMDYLKPGFKRYKFQDKTSGVLCV